MVYFCVQPSNRPTNTIYVLIINKLHVGWYVNQPNQPDQPLQFSRKRIRDAALSTFIHHYTFAAKSKSIKYDSRRTI